MTNRNLVAVFATAATAVTLGGCAVPNANLRSYSPGYGPDEATRVVNDPATAGTGVKQYGSAACREAGIRVIPATELRAYQLDRGYAPYFNRYGGYYGGSNPAFTVISKGGERHALIPDNAMNFQKFELAFGTALGAVAGNSVGQGHGRTAATLGGAWLGNLAGRALTSATETRARELGERCQVDVRAGAYDVNYGNLPIAPSTTRPQGFGVFGR